MQRSSTHWAMWGNRLLTHIPLSPCCLKVQGDRSRLPVSLDTTRRTSAEAISAAVHSALDRARELEVTSIAIPALGTGVGGFPLDEAARVTVAAVREALPSLPTLERVIFALRGAAAYQAFHHAIEAAAVSAEPGAAG